MSLEDQRILLEKINDDIFDLYQKRSKLVQSIHKEKKENSLSSWDIDRELTLFKKLYLAFNEQSFLFFVQFSIMLESHARECADYPRWSEGEHLEEISTDVSNFINPILLFVINKPKYQALSLTQKYKSKLDQVLK